MPKVKKSKRIKYWLRSTRRKWSQELLLQLYHQL